MLCSECKKNNATVFYRHTVNGNTTESALCPQCAGKYGILSKTSLFDSFFSSPMIHSQSAENLRKCSLCGSDENNFIKEGKVSCPECYTSFADKLSAPIKRIHGNVTHIGRAPAKFKKQNDKKQVLNDLKRRLNDAIKNQEFEDAAVLRDKIRDIENAD